MKILRRLVKIFQDLFSKKSRFVQKGLGLVESNRSISSSAFVKIFRIFLKGESRGKEKPVGQWIWAMKNLVPHLGRGVA